MGLVVLFILLYTVSNWWREYRSAGTGQTGSRRPRRCPPPMAKRGAGTQPAEADKSQSSTVVVLVDGLNLRVEPDNDAKSIRGLNKDEKLVLLKTDGKWYQVETAEGDEGWISVEPELHPRREPLGTEGDAHHRLRERVLAFAAHRVDTTEDFDFEWHDDILYREPRHDPG